MPARDSTGSQARAGLARVVALSHRQLSRAVWCSSAFEAQDVLAEITGADILAPLPVPRGESAIVRVLRRGLHRSLGVSVSFDCRVEPNPLGEKHDLFVCYAQSVRDLALLDAVPDWRRQCDRAVCWLEELWQRDFERPRWRRLLDGFDLVVTQFQHTFEALRHVIGARCEWLPGGIDALRFSPSDLDAPRSIDVFAMGRRSEPAHRELLQLAETRRWTYLFDTLHTHETRDVVGHRVQTAALIRRSRYFLVCPAKIDAPAETGGYEELGMRFFEGAAGGSVLIGAAPRTPAFAACFPWPDAVIPLPWSSSGISEILLELERDPNRLRAIRRANVVQCLRRHDWAYRWEQILRWLELPTPPALHERLSRLAARAGGLDGDSQTDARKPQDRGVDPDSFRP